MYMPCSVGLHFPTLFPSRQIITVVSTCFIWRSSHFRYPELLNHSIPAPCPRTTHIPSIIPSFCYISLSLFHILHSVPCSVSVTCIHLYLFILYLMVMPVNGVSQNNVLCVSLCARRASPLFGLHKQNETCNAMIIMNK